MRRERLGIVSYTNVAPLHWGLTATGAENTSYVYGVPSELNAALARREIDLTLVSSIEFIRHRHEYRALADFSIATLGSVYSVMLFHLKPWRELTGQRIAVTNASATSVELLRVLLAADGIDCELAPTSGNLDELLANGAAGALLIGDAALREALRHLPPSGAGPQGRGMTGPSKLRPELFVTDLGEAWYRLTKLPFTFAVWAAPDDRKPSAGLVQRFRESRWRGLGELAKVAAVEARKLELPPESVQRYLENFRYYLERPDLDGLMAFAKLSDPTFEADQLRFWDE